ncbi:TPA: hypothetical protein DCZ46_01075 [Candidatus Campbellbacteria bacterium]|nr:hypothetical protein [Candidatus Campbellbacteria bacterium]HAQ02193.1 hypothetical protein [Candidatus Campbellbacteria bacterium]HBC70540.1 hypothetical protein [Candidatus Campbellbacteria bacterium]
MIINFIFRNIKNIFCFLIPPLPPPIPVWGKSKLFPWATPEEILDRRKRLVFKMKGKRRLS